MRGRSREENRVTYVMLGEGILHRSGKPEGEDTLIPSVNCLLHMASVPGLACQMVPPRDGGIRAIPGILFIWI